jgi:hypothetical protein
MDSRVRITRLKILYQIGRILCVVLATFFEKLGKMRGEVGAAAAFPPFGGSIKHRPLHFLPSLTLTF